MDPFRVWLRVLVCLALASFGTGCGALSAATNPKVSWALNDPAPMTVVVRRADAAEATGKNVERLLLTTPIDEQGAWIGKTAPEKDEAQKKADEIAARDEYALTGARVIPAEVWSTSLAGVASAPPTLTAADVPKPEDAPKTDKRTKRAAKKKEAPAPPPPPPAPPKYASLLAAVDPALGEKANGVLAKKRELGEIEAKVATAEGPDKDALEKRADAARTETKALEKDLVAAAGASASKAPADVRDAYGPAFVNLGQAIEDASIANGAAALRYPLAAPTLVDSAQQMTHVYVADVIEEKTGKRPDTRALQPGVTIEGGKVQVTLNGLSPSDMGKLSLAEVTDMTATRTQKWVGHALGLLGSIAETKEVLELERDLVAALVDGFKRGGWTAPAPPALPTVTPKPPQGAQVKKTK